MRRASEWAGGVRRCRTLIACALFAGWAVPVAAQDDTPTDIAGGAATELFAGLVPLTDEVLAEKRGGIDIGGYQIEFGVVVTAQNELVASLATSLEALRDALAQAGQDPAVYTDAVTMLEANSLATIVVNDQDGVQLQQFIRIDVVINDAATPTLLNGGRDTLSLIGLPDTLPSF